MEPLQLLHKLGFTEYEARAYLALARLGPSTVREIVKESKLPRNKAYESLEKLERKNKVMSLPITPKKYKITDPSLLKTEVEDLNSSLTALIKIIEHPKQAEYKELFWIIKGKKAIVEKMAAENQRCVKEILICATLSKPFYRNMKILKEAIKRGVKVRIICAHDTPEEVKKEYQSIGAEIRLFNHAKFGPSLPRIGVYDNKTARLTIGKPEITNPEDYITLWSESKVFARMLRNHFMNMWKSSKKSN